LFSRGVERGDLGTDHLDLSNKHHQGCTRCHGQSLIALFTDDRRQLSQPEQSALRDDAEFAQVPTHGVHELRALANQLRARAVQHRQTLCSIPFTGTNDILGRVTATQIAAASIASVLPRLT
jgi:hypothetical protein